MREGLTVRMQQPFDAVVATVREALAGQGFGVLSEIDMKATFKAKLDVDRDEYVILGACNPVLANRALGVDPYVGVFLPCNVVVRQDGDDVVVDAVDPEDMVRMTGTQELAPVAGEVASRLRAALATLG